MEGIHVRKDVALERAAPPGRWLIITLGVVALAAMGLGVGLAVRNYDQDTHVVESQALQAADRTASQADRFLGPRQSAVAAVARRIDEPRGDVRAVGDALARGGAAHPELSSPVFLPMGAVTTAITASGRPRAATPEEIGMARDVLSTGSTDALAVPSTGGASGTIMVGAPTWSPAGDRTGAVVAGLRLREAPGFMPASGHAELRDGTSAVLSTPTGWRVVQRRAAVPMASSRVREVGVVTQADGEDALVATAPLLSTAWVARVSRPAGEALASARYELLMRLVLWLSLALAALVAGAWLGRRLSRSMRSEERGRRRLELLMIMATSLARAAGPQDVAEAAISETGLSRGAATVGLDADGRAIEVLAWRSESGRPPGWIDDAAVVSAVSAALDRGAGEATLTPPGTDDPVSIIPWRSGPTGPRGAVLLWERPPHGERIIDATTARALGSQVGEAMARASVQQHEHEARQRAEILALLTAAVEHELSTRDRAAAAVAALVPVVADFAAVEEIDDRGDVHLLACSHRDPHARDALERLRHDEASWADRAHALARTAHTGRALLVEDVPVHERDPVLDQRSILAVPLAARGGMRAVLVLGTVGPDARRFRPADLPFGRAIADAVGVGIENARLFDEQRRIALRLQLALLPGDITAPEGLDLAVRFDPGQHQVEVGGDWYDVLPLPEGRTGIVVGDVVGRGIEAAAVMGRLRFAFQALAPHAAHPGEALEALDQFARTVTGSGLTTVAYVVMDARTGSLQHACAGHPPPIAVAMDGTWRELEGGRSVPLNAVEPAPRESGADLLADGEVLVLYTDGLVERRGQSIDDGIAALAREVAREMAHRPGATCETIADSVLESLAGGDDDVVILCASRVSAPRAPDTPVASPDASGAVRGERPA